LSVFPFTIIIGGMLLSIALIQAIIVFDWREFATRPGPGCSTCS
jgi:hypothetical protein